MLKVSKLTTISGGPTEVSILFVNGKGKQVEDKKNFKRPEDATAYIRSTQRSWILQELENFILHKAIIIQSSTYYRNLKTFNSLGRCQDFLKWAVSGPGGYVTLGEICSYVLRLQTHLQDILPDAHNASYNTSIGKLNDILAFCQETILDLKKA